MNPPVPPAVDGTGDGGVESRNPLDLANGHVGGVVLAVVSFWVAALLIPGSDGGATGLPVGSSAANGVTVLLLGLAVVLPLVIIGITWFTLGRKKIDFVGPIVLFLFFLLLTALWWLAASGIRPFTSAMKVAFGIGGTALGALAIGLLLFRTLRVAASLPVVVLFIGLVAFPGARDVAGDLGPTLVNWMGGILGASAVAEGATQVARVVQRGGVSKAVADGAKTAGMSPGTAGDLRKALLPEVNERLPGDLR
ncbi:hypothetical protein [Pseudonocardia endophytica]|uniref:hypothetical protein n=1 Tax=Pseudonocardia endophytica TaxID=401976 RepID=UPI00104B236E|nr:hypothetical protein [Pseudonocardia endophytica]